MNRRPLLTAALLLAACGTDCPDGQTDVGGRCVPEVDVSVTAGETTTGGEGVTGGSTGGTTTGGTGGGTGGSTGGTMTGGSEMMPCDGACTGDTPLCLAADDSDAGMDMCVACIDEAQCNGDDLCDPLTHACVECVGDSDCSGEEDLCLEGTCVACKTDADCNDPMAARCDPADHTCKGCNDSTQCNGVEDGSGNALPVCNTNDGLCVQCTRNSHCSAATASTCDSSNNTCVACGATGNPDPDGDCGGIVDPATGVPLEVCDVQSAACVE